MNTVQNINNTLVMWLIAAFAVGTVFGSISSQMVMPSGESERSHVSDLAGTYRNAKNPQETITIYPDMTFFYQGKGSDTDTGTVTKQSSELVLKGFGSERFAILPDGTLRSTSSGEVWKKEK